MKANWETISVGLDQLFFNPFTDCESPQNRSDAIETFLNSNGWNWDEVLKEIAKETDGQPSIRN